MAKDDVLMMWWAVLNCNIILYCKQPLSVCLRYPGQIVGSFRLVKNQFFKHMLCLLYVS